MNSNRSNRPPKLADGGQQKSPAAGARAAMPNSFPQVTRHTSTRLVLPWPPTTGNNHYGKGRGGSKYLLPEVAEYRREVWRRWVAAGRHAYSGPVRMTWHITQPTRHRVDFENLSKVVMDALHVPTRSRFDDPQRARLLVDDCMSIVQRQAVNWHGVDKHGACIVVEVEDLGL